MKLWRVLSALCLFNLHLAPLGARPNVCNIDPSTGYCIVAGPIPCPANPFRKGTKWDCSILDLRIDVRPGETPQQGLFVRFIIPGGSASGAVPAMSAFPGTGSCFMDTPAKSLGCSCSPDTPCSEASGCAPFQSAQDGVLGVQFAERGSSHCYGEDDIMQPTATWIGATEFQDYDFVLDKLVRGKLHPRIPKVDAEKLGTTGSSHGGIEALIYATKSKQFKFALAVPDVGSPSLWSTWGRWCFDPTAEPSNPGVAGLVAVAGGSPQMHAYPQSTYTKVFTQAVQTGNWSGVAAFMRERSVYDSDGGLSTFHKQVKALYMRTGGRDCIVPGYGPVVFWEQLLKDFEGQRPRDSWVYDNYPHSCHETSNSQSPSMEEQFRNGGYWPEWTEDLMTKTDTIYSGVRVAAVRTELLGETYTGMVPRPALVTPMAHNSYDYRAIKTISHAAGGKRDFYLHDGKVLSEAVPRAKAILPGFENTNPSAICPKYDLLQPCGLNWNDAKVAATAIKDLMKGHSEYSMILASDTLLAGAGELTMTLKITGTLPVGLVAALYVAPPGSPSAYEGYLVTQGAVSLSHANLGQRDVTVSLDDRFIQLQKGSRLRLILSPISPGTVHGMPWLHPLLNSHTVQVVTSPSRPARLTLPVVNKPAGMPKANIALLAKGYWTWPAAGANQTAQLVL